LEQIKIIVIKNLASILENWRQKIKIGDFFGSNIFGAKATPDRCEKKTLLKTLFTKTYKHR
jgi:hypothetical protein